MISYLIISLQCSSHIIYIYIYTYVNICKYIYIYVYLSCKTYKSYNVELYKCVHVVCVYMCLVLVAFIAITSQVRETAALIGSGVQVLSTTANLHQELDQSSVPGG